MTLELATIAFGISLARSIASAEETAPDLTADRSAR